MGKYHFTTDYAEGAHPRILHKLLETNEVQQEGYGEDSYSVEAKDLLRQKLKNPEAAIYFVTGGTQANLLVISSLLQVHEAVISADSGHIFVHEAGAIEAAGHRIITVGASDGKIRPSDLAKVLEAHGLRPHVVKPRLVYISNSTELGSVYSKGELRELYDFCKNHGLYLFMDGARLGQALTAEGNDLTLADLSVLTDVFYLGGTKNGALAGEAVIFNNPGLMPDFDYVLKQRGALLAKGRFLGIQFLELFRDDLFFELARHANQLAMEITQAVTEEGYSLLTRAPTNQIFAVLPQPVIEKLSEKYLFYIWQEHDETRTVIRLVTSWATDPVKVREFIHDLKAAGLEN